MQRWDLIGLCLVMPLGVAAADAGTTSANFLTLGANPRAIAMGEAQTGLADDVYAAYWNPAGLAKLQLKEAGFVHSELAQEIRTDYAAYAHPTERWGTLAGAITHLRTGDFNAYDASGQPAGQVSASDTAIALSYAHTLLSNRRMGSDFSLGLTTKWIEERLDSISARAFAFDVGLLYTPGRHYSAALEGFKLGVAAKNFGTPMKFDRESFDLPRTLSGGLSWTGLWLGEKLTVALDGEKPQAAQESFGAGIELSTLRLLVLRTGYSSRGDLGSGLRLGAGLRFRTVQLDYSIAGAGELGQTHRMGLTFRFGIAPPDPLVLAQDAYLVGMKAYRRHQYSQALVEFNRALETDPTHPQALQMMKETHEKLKASPLQ